MSNMNEMPKAYESQAVEDRLYKAWEEQGFFTPERLPDRYQQGAPFCIMMPPPNRTGTLHMGHAMGMAIQDLMIRFERMRGKRALWVPGTDHAAIATQVKVEQILIKEGYADPRKELGREAFLERVVRFANESRDTIVNQTRKMGSSCDWTRERYTFDEDRNRAVFELFKMMFEDGLIERGYRIVNWDPQFQTTLSDDEVLTKDVTTKLLTFKYDHDFPIVIATTRPETKFGDTAVAVHPADDRYKHLIGKIFEPVFCGKKLTIKIVADEAVDPSFGTGALGVTPAHSMIDADIAVRHSLPTVPVIGKDGRMLLEVGEAFAGLTVQETREKVEVMLAQQGLLISVEEISQALPVAERGGAPVEQLPMEQWFVRVNKAFTLRQATLGKWQQGEQTTLKELMRYAVESNQTRIVPEQFEKIYYHWIDNLRDWCVSRQIWFGHRIPVWYNGDQMQVSDQSPGDGWIQDPDTLDTWFSSGSWTFSALGWPDKQAWEAHRDFHPTSVLETGKDILFFWIARMVLMSTYALGEVPFKDAYLHGLVRDEQGRKMSKSLGNIIDPLDMIPKYGTDAVRLSLIIGTTPGQDTKLSEAKIEGFRNFTNKLWNISRFILMQMNEEGVVQSTDATLADQWILACLETVKASVTKKLESYQFSVAGEELRDFTWNDLADWYLEIAKVEKGKKVILERVLRTVLSLWHPFMPFVTEAIWQEAKFGDWLIVSEWPTSVEQGAGPTPALPFAGEGVGAEGQFDQLRQLVSDMRRLRADSGVEPAKKIVFSLVTQPELQAVIAVNIEWMKRLTQASDIVFVDALPSSFAVTQSGVNVIGIDLSGTIDVAKERQKAEKELAQLVNYIQSTSAKLILEDFVSKAPAHVIDQMKAKLLEAQEKQAILEQRLTQLSNV